MLSVAKLSREICVIYSNAFVCSYCSDLSPGTPYLLLSPAIDYIYYPEPGFFVPHFLLPWDLRERLFSTPPDSYLSFSPLYLRLATYNCFFLLDLCLSVSIHRFIFWWGSIKKPHRDDLSSTPILTSYCEDMTTLARDVSPFAPDRCPTVQRYFLEDHAIQKLPMQDAYRRDSVASLPSGPPSPSFTSDLYTPLNQLIIG